MVNDASISSSAPRCNFSRKESADFQKICVVFLKDLFRCEDPKDKAPAITSDPHKVAYVTQFQGLPSPSSDQVTSVLDLLNALPLNVPVRTWKTPSMVMNNQYRQLKQHLHRRALLQW